jgi:hypothetical protein
MKTVNLKKKTLNQLTLMQLASTRGGTDQDGRHRSPTRPPKR